MFNKKDVELIKVVTSIGDRVTKLENFINGEDSKSDFVEEFARVVEETVRKTNPDATEEQMLQKRCELYQLNMENKLWTKQDFIIQLDAE